MNPSAVLTRKDDEMQLILFANPESARSFVDFVELYINESGAGNGYGAYWVFKGYDSMVEVLPEKTSEEGFTHSLEWSRIESMIRSIAHARSGGDSINTTPAITYGVQDNAIVFAVWGFDSGQVPQEGDMYRVVDWGKVQVGYASFPGEGRVLSVEDDHIIAIGSFDETDSGQPKEDAERHTIPIAAVMKIPDWLAAHRERRKSHERQAI